MTPIGRLRWCRRSRCHTDRVQEPGALEVLGSSECQQQIVKFIDRRHVERATRNSYRLPGLEHYGTPPFCIREPEPGEDFYR